MYRHHQLTHDRRLGELTDQEVTQIIQLADRKGRTPIVSRERIRETYRVLTALTVEPVAKRPDRVIVTPVSLSKADYPIYFRAGARAVQYALRALIRAGFVGETWEPVPDATGAVHNRRVVWPNLR